MVKKIRERLTSPMEVHYVYLFLEPVELELLLLDEREPFEKLEVLLDDALLLELPEPYEWFEPPVSLER